MFSLKRNSALLPGDLVGRYVEETAKVQVLGRAIKVCRDLSLSQGYVLCDDNKSYKLSDVYGVIVYFSRKLSYDELLFGREVWIKFAGTYHGPYFVVRRDLLGEGLIGLHTTLEYTNNTQIIMMDVDKVSSIVSWPTTTCKNDNIINGILSGVYTDGSLVDYLETSGDKTVFDYEHKVSSND